MRLFGLVFGAVLLLFGCTMPQTGTRSTHPTHRLDGSNVCHAPEGNTRPLLVEWPAADRAQLEAAANRGVVAVRYDGCQLQVLSRCELSGGYDYHPTTLKRDEVRIRDRDALWAKLPVGAARLEGALSRDGQINVDMTVVGQRQANVGVAQSIGQDTACAGATHVVSTMTVGAFSLYTGRSVRGGAHGSFGTAGAGADLSRATEVLRRDGTPEHCEAVAHDDPPTDCRAILRVELAPIGAEGTLMSDAETHRTQQAEALQRSATRWNGVSRGSRITAAMTATGAVVSFGFAVGRSVQIVTAKDERDAQALTAFGDSVFDTAGERSHAAQRLQELDADVDRYERSRRTATFVGVGLAIGTVGLIGLGRAARKRSQALQQRADTLSVSPVVGPRLSGLAVSGRF